MTMPASDLQIHRIAILPFKMVNAFLLRSSSGAILVDAGLPNTEAKVAKVLEEQGLTFEDIGLIVVTHAHIDHAGNAARLRELCDAPLLAHQGDLPYYLGEKPMTFCATGICGELFKRTGVIQKPYQAFRPDILLTDESEFDLQPYGIAGKVVVTGGHTEGSLALLLGNGEVMAGDLIASGILLGGICCTHKSKRPPFEDDPVSVGKVLESQVKAGFNTWHMGHGGPLEAPEVLRHANWLQTLESSDKQNL